MVAASALSGFAGIYFEKILKGSAPVSVWMRNIQLSVFAIPASFIASVAQDGSFIKEHGYLFGFDMVVWTMVFWLVHMFFAFSYIINLIVSQMIENNKS